MQHKIKSKEKNALINSGDRIEGRYQIIEKTNELTSQPMNEEWIAADELNENTLVILKFYLKRLAENTLLSKEDQSSLDEASQIVQSPLNLWRRNDDFFTDSIEECQELKIINYRIPQSIPNIKFDECLTPVIERPLGNDKAILDSNNATAVKIEKALSDYISTPFYNVLSKPKGVNLYELCIISSCRGILQIIAKDLMIGLQILSFDRQCYSHGNLQLRSIFWHYSKRALTLSNMKFNKIPISIIKESAPWAKDMVDIAMLLGKIIAKNLDFKFKNMNIRSPLDLFLKINSEIIGNYEKISRKKIAQKSSKNNNFPDINNITSRVVTLFNNEYRFVSQNSESFKNIDVDLGVPPNFNPFNENYSMEDLNKQLESSIYDFIVRLVGKTFEKNIKYDQFPSPDEALNHPFLSQKIDIRLLPSDI